MDKYYYCRFEHAGTFYCMRLQRKSNWQYFRKLASFQMDNSDIKSVILEIFLGDENCHSLKLLYLAEYRYEPSFVGKAGYKTKHIWTRRSFSFKKLWEELN